MGGKQTQNGTERGGGREGRKQRVEGGMGRGCRKQDCPPPLARRVRALVRDVELHGMLAVHLEAAVDGRECLHHANEVHGAGLLGSGLVLAQEVREILAERKGRREGPRALV